MDIRAAKSNFLDKLVDATTLQKQGVSLAIDCLIDNEVTGEDKPLVITSYSDYDRQFVCSEIKAFGQEIYPNAKSLFNSEILHVGGSSEIGACINLIKITRNRNSLLYWADSIAWFKYVPSGLFHVVALTRDNASRGQNIQASETIEPNHKEYSNDYVLTELFNGPTHINSANAISAQTAHDYFWDEAQSGVMRPIPAPAGVRYDDVITIKSAIWQKLACVALRRHQGKECNQGFNWDESDEGWRDVSVFPLVENLQINSRGETRECLIGYGSIEVDAGIAYLMTAWIHPLYRRKGLMTELWNKLCDIYGEIEVSEPNSNMQAFLKKVKS
jgi:hypothetical protein